MIVLATAFFCLVCWSAVGLQITDVPVLIPCPAIAPENAVGSCPQTASSHTCNAVNCLDQTMNSPHVCNNGTWQGTFCGAIALNWGQSLFSRYHDLFGVPRASLLDNYVFICPTNSVVLGHVWGNGTYSLDSDFCTAAAHATGVQGGSFDVHFTPDLILSPTQRAQFPAALRNGVQSLVWDHPYPVTFTVDGVHHGSSNAALLETRETRFRLLDFSHMSKTLSSALLPSAHHHYNFGNKAPLWASQHRKPIIVAPRDSVHRGSGINNWEDGILVELQKSQAEKDRLMAAAKVAHHPTPKMRFKATGRLYPHF